MNLVKSRQADIVNRFSQYASWEDRYRVIIAMGKSLPPLDDKYKCDENKVQGCQSQVWIHAELNDQGQVIYMADSDALIVKGLVALLLEVYSEASPDDILTTPVEFIKELGLAGHLSPSRSNGLYSMLKQIIFYATAFKSISS